MRVLVTGGNGQLGRELVALLRPRHEVVATDLPELDVRDADGVRRLVRDARPEVVLHPAALTDTRRCEEDPDLALAVNAGGTENVAKACRETGAAMLYVSTNEVFDGRKGAPYVESDAPGPINAYGRSKLAGEQRVRSLLERWWVVRTSWLYGDGEGNFPAKVLSAARAGSELSMVTDEVATPTWARDLAAAIIALIDRANSGVYHLTNGGECSRFEWARDVLRLAGRNDVPLKPTTLTEYNPYPPKPPYTALANREAASLGIELRPWQDALREFFSTHNP
ncbi:MAG: dTDP-4-dehydrorhamnose reductase [Dehalococcoidia bacterium]|nr:dTDP-4-dehydrorhamnose reductase [Dehalococcoidia bacterium]